MTKTYESPQVLRMKKMKNGMGACKSVGSGAVGGCDPGSGADECTDTGNSAVGRCETGNGFA